MELFALYLQFLSEICEGTRPPRRGSPSRHPARRRRCQAVQQAALEMGIDAFVRASRRGRGPRGPAGMVMITLIWRRVMQAMGQFARPRRRNRRPRRRPPRQMRQTTRRTRRRRSRSPTARAMPARSCLTAPTGGDLFSYLVRSCSRQRMKWAFSACLR